MGFLFCSCRIILYVLLVFLIGRGYSARKINRSEMKEVVDQDFQESSKHEHPAIKNGKMGHMANMDPSFNVFFTIEDLKIGKKIPVYFPNKNSSTSPHLLSREEANSIPFSSQQLPHLLQFFSFSEDSPQAKGMEYTLSQCETEPIKGETKLCAASLETMLDFVRVTFGLDTQFKVLTTNYLVKPVTEFQNYAIMESPKEIKASRIIGCHVMPYPYVVYYCHSRESGNRVFKVSLGGENGERIEAAAICHMDTSQWDHDHVSFRLLKMEPGSSPVCHFLPADNLVWVPLLSAD